MTKYLRRAAAVMLALFVLAFSAFAQQVAPAPQTNPVPIEAAGEELPPVVLPEEKAEDAKPPETAPDETLPAAPSVEIIPMDGGDIAICLPAEYDDPWGMSLPPEDMRYPSGDLTGIIIGIDPGHQARGNSEREPVAPGSSELKAKVSSGTAGVSTGIAEYITNLEISLQLRDALEARGATVYMTRETHDVNISNVERAVMMNEYGCDLVLRIHCNGSENSSVNGIGLYVRASGDCTYESYSYANIILPAMAETTGANSQGVFSRDTYTGMNWSKVPCILVEMGYMSNPEEDVLLNTPEYQQKLVDGMVNGVLRCFGRE